VETFLELELVGAGLEAASREIGYIEGERVIIINFWLMYIGLPTTDPARPHGFSCC